MHLYFSPFDTVAIAEICFCPTIVCLINSLAWKEMTSGLVSSQSIYPAWEFELALHFAWINRLWQWYYSALCNFQAYIFRELDASTFCHWVIGGPQWRETEGLLTILDWPPTSTTTWVALIKLWTLTTMEHYRSIALSYL